MFIEIGNPPVLAKIKGNTKLFLTKSIDYAIILIDATYVTYGRFFEKNSRET